MSISLILLLVVTLVRLAIFAFVIYAAVQGVKALRKYNRSGEVRKEKAETRRSLGEVLKEHRVRCKMTQEFVAESLGVSRQAVSKWETGTADPSTSNLLALALGDPTAKSMHRLSLNPLHHIDWLGLALMFTVGFGWAKPVPVNPNYFRKPKQGMAVTALAGPVSNLLLAVLFLGIGKVIYLYAPYSEGMNVFFEWCLFTVAPMSVGMGLFNLIPIPPLDGSKVLAMFLPNSAYGQLMRYERYGILVLLALSWLGLGGNFLGNAIYGVYEALFHIFFA